MDFAARVKHTPFYPRACENAITVRILQECRRNVPGPPGHAPIYFFGSPSEATRLENVTQIFEFPAHHLPHGLLYSDFRRRAHLLIAQEREGHFPDIILFSTLGMDLCAYLIVRWLIDERDCSVLDALTDFNAAFAPGIRGRFTYEILYDLFRHDPAIPVLYRSRESRAISVPVPEQVNIRGVEDPAKPEISERTKRLIRRTVCFFKKRVSLSVSEPIVFSFVEELPPVPVPRLDVSLDDLLARMRGVPQYESIGEAIESRSCAFLISALNRKFGQIRTTPPFSPMRVLDQFVIDEDAGSYGIVAMPHGIKLLLYVNEQMCNFISEKSVARCVNSSIAFQNEPLDNTVFEGYLCESVEESKSVFAVVDLLLLNGADLRNEPYVERLEKARLCVLATDSEFDLAVVDVAPILAVDELFGDPGSLPFPVAGVLVTKTDGVSGLGGSPELYFWKIAKPPNPVVQVKFVPEASQCVGQVNDRNVLKKMVEFGVAKPNLIALSGTCVDLRFDHGMRQWQIIGPSAAAAPWTFAAWNRLVVDGAPPLSLDELRAFFADLVRAAQ
jgi:hypothetical protein